MLLGKDAILSSISRFEPTIEVSPRPAAMHASKILASSSRTWFSTGINKVAFLNDILVSISAECTFSESKLCLMFQNAMKRLLVFFSFCGLLYFAYSWYLK
jgi:hypothetical protein